MIKKIIVDISAIYEFIIYLLTLNLNLLIYALLLYLPQ